MKHRSTSAYPLRPWRHSFVHVALAVVFAGLAAMLLLGGCGSSSGGGVANAPSSTASAPAPVDVATTWTKQDPSSAASSAGFFGVSFVDAAHGWAVGFTANDYESTAVILATSDGGATWKAQQPSGGGKGVGLTSISFVDAEHGWAVGVQMRNGGDMTPVILATSNGGATWTAQDADAVDGEVELRSVSFVDAAHGWAVGYIFTGPAPVILATSDGGANWKAQDASGAGTHAELNSVAFTDATHGWAVGYNDEGRTPLILATSDGGATWKAQDASSAGPGAQLRSVAFVDASNGWAVGTTQGDAPAPVILATRDGGATWRAQDAGGAGGSGMLSSVTFFDAVHGWAVGDTGTDGDGAPVILATNDGGVVWKAQDAGSADSSASLLSVTSVDAAHGWLVGTTGEYSQIRTPVILATAK